MREIKFRAISKQDYDTNNDNITNGQWAYGYYYFCRSRMAGRMVTTMTAESGGIGSGLVQVEIEVDHKTLGQYTGLKDKNGKEIYEGDILRRDATFIDDVSEEEREIENPYSLKPVFVVEWSTAYKPGWDIWGYPCSVIGNIHENPELTEPK